MRVLVVEDDRRLAEVVRDDLAERGHAADIVGDGETALRAVASSAYDVIVLDVMLGPGMDGIEVCGVLRARDVPSAVIMLTALDSVTDRVRGLNAGADDYLAKPFSLDELEARVQAVVRRHRPERSHVRECRGMRLDSRSRQVTARGRELLLTRKEFDVLEALMSTAGHVVSKERLLEQVWGFDAVQDANAVEVHVARLRRKIAAAGGDDCIVTLRNAGYRLVPDAELRLVEARP